MKAVRGVLSVILSVLIFLSAFISITTAIVKFKLTDVEYYVQNVITDEYIEALRKDIYNNVTIICENLEVHRDTVMNFVDNPELKRISESHFRTTYSALINGTPLEYERFENDGLKTEIYKELEAFANEMGIVGEDISHATDLNYDYIIDDINETLTYFTQENMNMVSFVSQIPALDFAINNAFFVVVAVLIVLCVLKFLVMWKKVRSCAYNVSFMLWLASALWFIPVTVIKLQDITLNLAIAHSGFKIYLRNIINSVIDGAFNISLIAFVVSAVLLVASIVIILVSIRKRTKSHDDSVSQTVEEVSQEG